MKFDSFGLKEYCIDSLNHDTAVVVRFVSVTVNGAASVFFTSDFTQIPSFINVTFITFSTLII